MFAKKNIIFIITSLLYCNHLYPQQNSPVPTFTPSVPLKNVAPIPTYRNQDLTTKFLTIDPKTGKAFENTNREISGFPFFTEEWKYSLIKLSDGRIVDMIKTRMDLSANALYFKSKNEVDMVFDTGYIKEVDIYDSHESKNVSSKFKTGFPKIDNQNQYTYYQVLSEGKVGLLNLIRKQLSVNKDVLSGEVEKRFETYTNYYVFSKNKMQRFKKEKDFILKILSDKKNEVEIFCSEKNINFKNINDIVSLFNYYNSLNS